MATHKKLIFPSSDIKNKLFPLLGQNRYSALDSTLTDNFVSICDEYEGQALYTEVFDKNSFINYKGIIRDLVNFPSHKQTFPTLKNTECLEMISKLKSGYTHKEIDQFKKGIFYCDTCDLEELLKIAFEDIFFSKFPDGKIISVRLDSIYYKRSGLIRGMYSLNQYPEMISKTSGIDGFESMKNWINVESNEIFDNILEFSEYFFFPYINSFHVNYRVGQTFVFITTSSIEYKLGSYPRDMLDFIRFSSDFGKQQNGIENLKKENLYGKYCFDSPLTTPETEEFILWSIDRSNEFIKTFLDINNFTEADDPKKIDPIYALEYNLTLLHLIKIGLAIISSNSTYFNKSMTFQAADILSEISNIDQLGVSSSIDYFKRLFNKDEIVPIIRSILNSSQLSFKSKLITLVDTLYDNLNETIKDSIWLAYKISRNDVTVKNSNLNGDNIESISIFASNVIRVLRNAHHGYFTRKDRPNRPSRYLSLIDGNTPDNISTLTLIWLLCLFEDRNAFIGQP